MLEFESMPPIHPARASRATLVRLVALVSFALALGACSSKTHTIWKHDELSSTADLNRDHFECRMQLKEDIPESTGPQADPEAAAWNFMKDVQFRQSRTSHYEACMVERGWYQVEVPVGELAAK